MLRNLYFEYFNEIKTKTIDVITETLKLNKKCTQPYTKFYNFCRVFFKLTFWFLQVSTILSLNVFLLSLRLKFNPIKDPSSLAFLFRQV